MWATPVISRVVQADVCPRWSVSPVLVATATAASEARNAQEGECAWSWNNRDAGCCNALVGDSSKGTNAHRRSDGHDSVAVVGGSSRSKESEAEVVGCIEDPTTSAFA